jgi:hypothetical protein
MAFLRRSKMKGLREAPRRALAEGQQLIAEFEATGLSRKAFCRSRSLSTSTLDYWRKRISSQGQRLTAASQAGFIELAPLGTTGALDIELELGGGVVLRLRRSA